MAATATIQNVSRGTTNGSLNLGSYATGGVAVTPSMFGYHALVGLDVNPSAGYVCEYVPTSADPTAGGKVKVYWTGAGLSAVLAEITNATNLAAVNFRFEADGY